jgi:hypothetical protein
MNFNDIPTLLVALGVGGLVGAVAAAITASSRLSSDFQTFRSVFRAYMIGKEDPASKELAARFETLNNDVASASSAFDRVKRALKRR